MYEFIPISPRVERLRAMYRDTVPYLDTTRYRIVTEFYQQNRALTGNLKRALNFKNMCEKTPVFIRDDELLLGSYTATFKGAALYPEYSIRWVMPELLSGALSTRECDPYQCREEDKQYIIDTVDFWDDECLCSKVNPYIPPEYAPLWKNCAVTFTPKDICPQPVGHFAPNYVRPLTVGFKAVKQQADDKIAQLLEAGAPGDTAEELNFYSGVSIVCDGMMTYAMRYSEECARLASESTDSARKAELEQLSQTMGWIIANPARSFREALQALWFYQMCILMDGNMHGTSVGRLDQVLGPYAEADIASGAITREETQELIDLYYLKVAECNKVNAGRVALSVPGYTSGQLITLGGVDIDGNDATNCVTYMCLEAMGRMKMHSPSQALRVHRGTPRKLMECAVAVNRIAGGVPSYFSDDAIINSLSEQRGVDPVRARDYCLIGCVEPSMGGAEWPASGGMGVNSYINFATILNLAINDGKSMMGGESPFVDPETQFGPATGRLSDMTCIEDVQEAYLKQMRYWVQWYVTLNNIFEVVARHEMPQPLVSAMMTGCMESGKDVMSGGARYNSVGVSGIGHGNVVESLSVIDELCFKRKKCTTAELLQALVDNWDGHEELREYIVAELPHYGNAEDAPDRFVKFVAESFADMVREYTSPRGCRYAPGMFPVTMNVTYGKMTAATPDGRRQGDPLADGISGVQGLDVNGPTAILNSVTKFDHSKYSNGILLNMKFHSSAVANDDGLDKLIALMKTYLFDMGGMELQLNIVSADTLRDAQAHPENYRDLVVRIAGFSAYFVEVYKAAQDDLIRRTELAL